MADFKTVENLGKAFIGESMARNRYSMYASIARKECYRQISDIFIATADNEMEHAEWNMRMLNSILDKGAKKYDPQVEWEVPHMMKTTVENLAAAIEGEHYETTTMYPEFANVADKEGFPAIATRLRAIGRAEAHHEERYSKLLANIKAGTVLKKSEKVKWVCSKCGYIHEGNMPPGKCPACDHDGSYYSLLNEIY